MGGGVDKGFSICKMLIRFPRLCWLSEIIADATVQWHVNYAPLRSGTCANSLEVNKATWILASNKQLLGKRELAVNHESASHSDRVCSVIDDIAHVKKKKKTTQRTPKEVMRVGRKEN